MAGRVEADARTFELPFTVLVGRNSNVITDYEIEKLPRVIIVRREGKIAFTQRFAPYDKLKGELTQVLASQPQAPPKKAIPPKKSAPPPKGKKKK